MSKVAMVTGANQGLGYALVAELCRTLPPGSTVYLTARDTARGRAAREKLVEAGQNATFYPLDVTKDDSVEEFADLLRSRHGGVDIVISNAAARITKQESQAEQVRGFIATNNHGTHRIIRKIAPLLRDGARFVVVASAFGSLRHLAPVHHRHFDVAHASLEDVEAVMDRYVERVEAGRHTDEQWPEWINIPSKVAQVALLKILARNLGPRARERDIIVNAACPGLVDTEASRPWFADMSSAQSPERAAVDVVWLATLAPGAQAPFAELVQYRKILSWS